jgi:hypothetical protein
MKSKLCLSILAIVLAWPIGMASAQNRGVGSNGASQSVPVIDPATGLPLAQADPEWKDPEWKDPDVTVSNVNFDLMPVGDIANLIRDEFKGEFDVILPSATSEQGVNTLTGTLVPPTDWKSYNNFELRLKNVTASELFHAMNLIFENDKTPLRWELKVNGHRRIALLRLLVDKNSTVSLPPPSEPMRRIYFVGDLIGDEKSGGMSMEEIIKTITDIWQMTDTTNGNIQFHKGAQLLVVTGTPDQIAYAQDILNGLKQKTQWDRFKSESKPADAKSKMDEPKGGASTGSR